VNLLHSIESWALLSCGLIAGMAVSVIAVVFLFQSTLRHLNTTLAEFNTIYHDYDEGLEACIEVTNGLVDCADRLMACELEVAFPPLDLDL
jgi:uncharacterized membrane-anchored protein YhcB (DUF1043 family)